ncbi:regulatory protein YycH of two-component signal transduction system YycFG [Streptohalobacillus salinus]|uniref:Regulatory protein YycH of two-component signal transduction system YycFG n=1 Tax=Streptohalobacillus salinus TaxID=621096 RepID=A0A2V3W996_9BACI|nr:two-component system activity regulator YycH [Streptohalobacillus salinus]PXW89778.1 regulatory protein YycH of two-component signal transduction system YycFG [Streptohalobacillus salinus]
MEQLKSIILISLITSSLLLTYALWSNQSDYQVNREEEALIDAELRGGERLNKSEVITPTHMIARHSDFPSPIGFNDEALSTDFYQRFRALSLYNFSVLTFSNNWFQEVENRIEIVFQTELPSYVIYDLFDVDQETYVPEAGFNRIIVLEDHDVYQVLFKNDQTDTVIAANAQNFDQNYQTFMNLFNQEEGLRSYQVFEGSRGTEIYLPEETTKQVLLFSYTDLDTDAFQNLLFSNPAIVRSAYTIGGDTNLIDGTREMVIDSKHIQFTNLTNEQKEVERELTAYQLFDQVQSYLNAHLGFTFSEPFGYRLNQIQQTSLQSEVSYHLTYRNTPIFYEQELAEIAVHWHNQSLYQYKHPLIVLLDQRGVGQTLTELPTAEEVIEILQGPNYQGTAIYDVVLGYRFTEPSTGQGQVYALTPTWYVRGIHGFTPLVEPVDEEGGVSRAMGPN